MSAPEEERWSVLAVQIANENDPERLSALVKKLIDDDRVDEKAPTTKAEQHQNQPESPGKLIQVVGDTDGIIPEVAIDETPQTICRSGHLNGRDPALRVRGLI
jgi:hypothetical protein